MSTSIVRRESKKSLQNLLRLTTQWSVEDEEEAARERRRRERQQQEGGEGQSPDDLDDENCTQRDNHVELKPAGPWETEEDEGFSDWSQKLVQRKLKGAAQAAEETEEPRFTDEEQTEQTRATEEFHTYNTVAQVEEEDEGTTRNEEVEINDELEACREEREATSYNWETREIDYEDNRPPSPRVPEEEFEEQGEQEEIHVTARDQEQYQNQWVSDEMENRRQSVSSDGEEGDGTLTVKITERAEILNRSIQKSNSIKRSEPPMPIHKIDDRLEQYTHAIETSIKPGRLARQPSLELLSPTDPVSNIKNRWEIGDVTTAAKASSCKDTEGINIGVSDMINQWGKDKTEPDGQGTPLKLAEVKPGDVLSKKSLWEQGSKSGQMNKNAASTKKYKFVPVGHGKYEKILVDEP
ncbi:PREDICTED: lymphocyte-specific protein 1 [Nanorana parkeri]|uniref:lymphocyte-specific protein 1 n=1 Tax=Nanorana parkeri TaxID=125878 RepID=UPI00085502CE|nr:PREDICTED: lymphocyte-specific protein 1 [Nanorana parkeri]